MLVTATMSTALSKPPLHLRRSEQLLEYDEASSFPTGYPGSFHQSETRKTTSSLLCLPIYTQDPNRHPD